jgi:very-short-patch-repair endonuclease
MCQWVKMRSDTDKAQLFRHAWNVIAHDFPAPVDEHRFAPPRRWRFDFAWVEQKIAVEIEGNAWHVRGGGKHMQDNDLHKYNIATAQGWRVFRFSPKMLKENPAGCVDIVLGAMK